MKKKILSILIAAVLTVSGTLPVSAAFENENDWEIEMQPAEEVQQEETSSWNAEDTDEGFINDEMEEVSGMTAQKAADVERLEIAGETLIYMEEIKDIQLPAGVSYNASTNTITLSDSSIWLPESVANNVEGNNGINYLGTRDLNIILKGTNVIYGNTGGGWAIRRCERSGMREGAIRISGGGKLTVKNGSGFFRECYHWSPNEIGGNLEIDGVTIESDGNGIMSQYHDVIIRNSNLVVNNTQIPEKSNPMGIVIGYIKNGKGFSGKLTVVNSKIELKNCLTTIACNSYQFSKIYCYYGNNGPEKEVDPNELLEQSTDYEDRKVRRENYILMSPTRISTGGDTENITKATPVLRVKDRTTSKVTISWNQVDGAQGYTIWYRSEYDSKVKRKIVNGGNKTSWSHTGLKPGTKYFYTIKAWVKKNGKYIFSKQSPVQRGTTKPQAAKIQKVTVNNGKVKVALTGKARGAEMYSMCYSQDSAFASFQVGIRTSQTTRTVSKTLEPGTYYIRVKSYRDLGNSKRVYGDWSNTVKVTVKGETAGTGGKCGENVNWKLSGTTLTISGTGPMYDWNSYEDPTRPWEADDDAKIKKIVIEKGVTRIGNYGFSQLFYATDITIPNTVTSIGNYAFVECVSFKNITIPNSVREIGTAAFGSCFGLKKLHLPDSVTTIGSQAFWDCFQCQELILPANLKEIPSQAFRTWTALTEVTIPENVKSIASDAFLGCSSLKKMYFTGDMPKFDMDDETARHLTCYYPSNNSTWSGDLGAKTNPYITWVPYTPA